MILKNPALALGAIPALLFLVWLLRKDFVPGTFETEADAKRKNRTRWWLLLSRSLLIVLVFLALAHPVLEEQRFADADPQITVLLDNSTSMEVLDTSAIQPLLDALEERVPVRVRTVGGGGASRIGEDVLGYLSTGENLLLVSDGQVTSGATLSDVSAFAGRLNATVNAVSLTPRVFDAAVSVDGPEKTVAETNTTYLVRLSKTRDEDVDLRVSVDGEVVFDDTYGEDAYALTRSFSVGEHTINARISGGDHFSSNNNYTRTVTVVPKPRILYLSREPSGLEDILSQLYSVDQRARMPQNLSAYYVVVLNDLPSSALPSTDRLTDYLRGGNGLFVVGGQDSYDFGGYQGTVFETLLPVRVGAGDRTRGGANIVVAIDLSGSTRGAVKLVDGELVRSSEELVGLEKALAASLVEELNPSNYVGVLGFTYPQPSSPYGCSGACVLHEIGRLGENKQAVVDTITGVNITGGTSMTVGVEGALEMLRSKSGSKNVLFISDGVSNAADRESALNAARVLAAQGGRLFAVRVGDSEGGAQFMQRLAQAGEGIYFPADESNRLSVLFGEPVDVDQGDAFDVFALNDYHFITQDVDFSAPLYGYNQVVPKKGAQLLVTSNAGDPVLTVWNVGVGRVASLTAFDGEDLGGLLSLPDSKVLSRTVNWLIGDPERKSEYVVDVADASVGGDVRVTVTADKLPVAQDLSFSPLGEDRYAAELSADRQGVFSVLSTKYAVNYPAELRRVGVAEGLEESLSVSGGQVFSPDEPDRIVEHVKTLQQLERVEEVSFRWPFVLAALVVFLLEVSARRIAEVRRR